jgi:uncharacterized protein
LDPAIVEKIHQRLDDVRRAERVAIPLAVESGSRAWGFPSPDSDYDCRFIYIRRLDDYLTPWRKRDVIETPLDHIFDVSGWDLSKTLPLLLKGNAVVIEWLTSPIDYFRDQPFAEELLAFARETVERERIAYHYLHLGERQRRTYFQDDKNVRRKKLFYALRPAAALRWLRRNPTERIAPMNFQTLMAECEPPAHIVEIVERLLAEKLRSNELGAGPVEPALAAFIDEEFVSARVALRLGERKIPRESIDRAEAFFLSALHRYAPD